MAKTYSGLLRRRILVATLTLGLVAVVLGVLIDLIVTGQRSTIAAPTQKLIAPLNPQLDLEVLEQLEAYELVTFEQAREGVRAARALEGTESDLLSPILNTPDTPDSDQDTLPTQGSFPTQDSSITPANQGVPDNATSTPVPLGTPEPTPPTSSSPALL